MGKKVFGLIIVLLLCGTKLYAADGDLIVNGNLGIGTTPTADRLLINNGNMKFDTADKGISFFGGGERIIGTAGFGIDFQTNNGTSRMTILNGSYVGIGTANPPYKLSVNLLPDEHVYINQSAASYQTQIIFADRGTPKWGMGKQTDNAFFLYENASGRSLIYAGSGNISLAANGGNVGIGVIYPSYQLHVASDSAAKPATSTWTIGSDARLKSNIQPYTKGLKEILQINPVSYNYNGKGGIGHNKVRGKDPVTGGDIETEIIDTALLAKTNVGVLAQDIQAVVPETVSSHRGKLNKDDADETDLLDFNSHALTFILINAVKELSVQVDSLNKQIADLKATVK